MEWKQIHNLQLPPTYPSLQERSKYQPTLNSTKPKVDKPIPNRLRLSHLIQCLAVCETQRSQLQLNIAEITRQRDSLKSEMECTGVDLEKERMKCSSSERTLKLKMDEIENLKYQLEEMGRRSERKKSDELEIKVLEDKMNNNKVDDLSRLIIDERKTKANEASERELATANARLRLQEEALIQERAIYKERALSQERQNLQEKKTTRSKAHKAKVLRREAELEEGIDRRRKAKERKQAITIPDETTTFSLFSSNLENKASDEKPNLEVLLKRILISRRDAKNEILNLSGDLNRTSKSRSHHEHINPSLEEKYRRKPLDFSAHKTHTHLETVKDAEGIAHQSFGELNSTQNCPCATCTQDISWVCPDCVTDPKLEPATKREERSHIFIHDDSMIVSLKDMIEEINREERSKEELMDVISSLNGL